jgi:raffinose/stachyose/melibiose transport system permease protein
MTISGKKRYFYFFVFTAPALFLFSLFFIWPLINAVRYSFTDWKGGGTANFIGIENFRGMFDPRRDQWFMPDTCRKPLFKETYELPFSIDAVDYEDLLPDRIKSKDELAVLQEAYDKRGNGKYALKENLNEYVLFDKFAGITGMGYDRIASVLVPIKKAAASGSPLDTSEYLSTNLKSDGMDHAALTEIVNRYYAVYKVKKILAQYMYRNEIKSGTVGFTLLYMAINLVCGNIVALMLALFLDRKMKMSGILRTVFFLPAALSLITISFLWSFLFDKILTVVSVADIRLGNPMAAPFLVSFAGVWRHSGFLMLIYTAGLQCIPAEYLEAADIDGASGWQKLTRITGPLLLPAFAACAFWSVTDSLRSFDIVFGFDQAFKYANNTVPIVLDLYINAMKNGRFGYATAKSLSLCLIVVILNAALLLIIKRRKTDR